MRQHLLTVWRATGRRPAELDIPPLPAAARDLWHWYTELAAARDSNGFAPNAIGWKDLAAWQQVCDFTLTPWEAETLIFLDRAVRVTLNKKD